MLAIIGGTGLYELPGLRITQRIPGNTSFGQASGDVLRGQYHGQEVLFLARHGSSHCKPNVSMCSDINTKQPDQSKRMRAFFVRPASVPTRASRNNQHHYIPPAQTLIFSHTALQ